MTSPFSSVQTLQMLASLRVAQYPALIERLDDRIPAPTHIQKRFHSHHTISLKQGLAALLLRQWVLLKQSFQCLRQEPVFIQTQEKEFNWVDHILIAMIDAENASAFLPPAQRACVLFHLFKSEHASCFSLLNHPVPFEPADPFQLAQFHARLKTVEESFELLEFWRAFLESDPHCQAIKMKNSVEEIRTWLAIRKDPLHERLIDRRRLLDLSRCSTIRRLPKEITAFTHLQWIAVPPHVHPSQFLENKPTHLKGIVADKKLDLKKISKTFSTPSRFCQSFNLKGVSAPAETEEALYYFLDYLIRWQQEVSSEIFSLSNESLLRFDAWRESHDVPYELTALLCVYHASKIHMILKTHTDFTQALSAFFFNFEMRLHDLQMRLSSQDSMDTYDSFSRENNKLSPETPLGRFFFALLCRSDQIQTAFEELSPSDKEIYLTKLEANIDTTPSSKEMKRYLSLLSLNDLVEHSLDQFNETQQQALVDSLDPILPWGLHALPFLLKFIDAVDRCSKM